MTSPYPLPRSVREDDVALAIGATATGARAWVLYDPADIAVYWRPDGATAFARLGPEAFTVAPAAPESDWPAYPVITLASPAAAAGVLRIRGERLHERQAGVTIAGAISASALEREFTRIGIVLQETRRDLGSVRDDRFRAETAANTAVAQAVLAGEAAVGAGLSATAAAEAAADAGAALATFRGVYLGAFGSDPITDGNGDPIGAGDMYLNTAIPALRLYTGTAWINAPAGPPGADGEDGADGQPGPPGEGGSYPSLAAAAATTIPAALDFVMIAGHTTIGTGGGIYARVASEPSHAGKFQDAGGAWFELRTDKPSPFHFVAISPTVDSVAAWQAAVDYCLTRYASAGDQSVGGAVVDVPAGRFRWDGPLKVESDVKIDLGKSELKIYGPLGFDIGLDPADPDAPGPVQIFDPSIENGRINLMDGGATAFKIWNAYGVRLRNINLRMEGANQVGVDIIGMPEPPNGPYYGDVGEMRIFGTAVLGHNQVGVRLRRPADSLPIAGGVNRWVFPSIRHISSVAIGADIRSAWGMTFDNVNFENIQDSVVRFNHRDAPDYVGTVTVGGNSSTINDSAFVATARTNVASVIITSGENAGYSGNVHSTTNGQILLELPMPWGFSPGDTFELYLSDAVDVTFTNVTCEAGANYFVDFKPGARNCRVIAPQVSLASGSTLMRRGHEDISNTVARERERIEFISSTRLGAGAGVDWLEPDFQFADRGGAMLYQRGWVEAIYVTTNVRNFGTPGLITVDVFANGQVIPQLSTLLTSRRPNKAHRVARIVSVAGLLTEGAIIKVRVTRDAAVEDAEVIRAGVLVGYL